MKIKPKVRAIFSKDSTDEVLVVIANFDFSENADKLKRGLEPFFETILIDAESPQIPTRVDTVIPNQYYPGLWNAAVQVSLNKNFGWLLFIASDVVVENFDGLARSVRSTLRNTEIGVWSPSLNLHSRSSFELQKNRLTSGIREVGIIEGFIFLARTNLLSTIFPAPPENRYGWGIDIALCFESFKSGLKVVVDDAVKVFHPEKLNSHEIDDQEALRNSNDYLGEEILKWVGTEQSALLQNSPSLFKSISLDLGSGPHIQNPFNADDAFGIDINKSANPKVIRRDLLRHRIPFSQNSLDYITAFDFIEHIPRSILRFKLRYPFIEIMNEIWRCLKPGGIFLSLTPAFPDKKAFQDPTHVNFITEDTFLDYFCLPKLWANMYGFHGKFELESQSWEDGKLRSYLRAIK